MHRVVDASTAQLGYRPKIGFVVVPHNMSSYVYMFDGIMHEVFDCNHPNAQRGDFIRYDFIDRRSAAQRAFNLTNPDTLGVAWAEDGHENWRYEYDYYPEDIFADDANYVILVRWQPDYLEITY
jgi:hypothetical protein